MMSNQNSEVVCNAVANNENMYRLYVEAALANVTNCMPTIQTYGYFSVFILIVILVAFSDPGEIYIYKTLY